MILLLPPFILLSINPPPHLSLTLLLPPVAAPTSDPYRTPDSSPTWWCSVTLLLEIDTAIPARRLPCPIKWILGLLLTPPQSCSVNHDDHYERFLGPLAICLSPFSVFTSIPHYRLKLTYTILTNSISYVLSPTFISTLTALGLGRLPCLAL